MKFPNYKNNFSFLPKNALYRADNITANHFFTTRNSDTDILPFEIIQAEKQIHSADIIYINDYNINKPHYCDGFVISESSFLNTDSSYGIAVRTADCVPIILYDPNNKVAAAVHAGWRGTIAKPDKCPSNGIPGIAANAVRIMTNYGAEKSKIQVAVGAAIHSCCFEVKNDFLTAIRDSIGNKMEDFIISRRKDGISVFFYDLPLLNAWLLTEEGINPDNINIASFCTACDTNNFYSFRKEKKLNGTMISAIQI